MENTNIKNDLSLNLTTFSQLNTASLPDPFLLFQQDTTKIKTLPITFDIPLPSELPTPAFIKLEHNFTNPDSIPNLEPRPVKTENVPPKSDPPPSYSIALNRTKRTRKQTNHNFFVNSDLYPFY